VIQIAESIKHYANGIVDMNEEKKVNPWAVCHASTGPEKDAKFERCVKKVKKKQGMKEEDLPGNQDVLDSNKNGKLDSEDFKILRKKKVKKARESLAERILNELEASTLKSYRAKAMKQDPTETSMKREKGISKASTKITKAAQGKNTKKSVMGGTSTQSSTSAYGGTAGDSSKQSTPMARSEINKAKSSGQEGAKAAANEKAFSKLAKGLAKKN
jgi:hypothetical protein